MNAGALREQLQRGETWITARGQSMAPLWNDGDRLLVKSPQQLRCGDIFIYADENQLIAHRLLKIESDSLGQRSRLKFKADAGQSADPWVSSDQLVGQVVAIEKAGKVFLLTGRATRWRSRWNDLFNRFRSVKNIAGSGKTGRALFSFSGISPDQRRLNWGHNVLNYLEARKVFRELEHAGCQPVLLKGPVLMLDGIVDLEERDCGDLDIWVPPDQSQTARSCLARNGFLPPGWEPASSIERRRKIALVNERGAIVDLHWTFINGGARHQKSFKLHAGEILSRTRILSNDYGAFRCLSVEDHFLYLCLHLALGGFSGEKWWYDLYRFREVFGESMDWELLLQRARQWRASVVLWAVLDGLFQYYGQPVHPWLLGRCRPGWIRRRWIRRCMPVDPKVPVSNRALRYCAELLCLDGGIRFFTTGTAWFFQSIFCRMSSKSSSSTG